MAPLYDFAPRLSCQLINAIQTDGTDAELLFRNKFERAIRLLLRRRIDADFEIYSDAAIAATLQAVRCFAIKSDADLPKLIREQLDNVLSIVPKDLIYTQPSTQTADLAARTHEILSRLLKCSAKEREILRLFYVVGEDEMSICRRQNIRLQRFRALLAVVRRAVGFSLTGDNRRKTLTVEPLQSSDDEIRRSSQCA